MDSLGQLGGRRLLRLGGIQRPGYGDEMPSFQAALMTSLVAQAFGDPTATFTRATTKYVLGYAAAAVIADGPTLIQCASGEAGFMGARRVSQGVWSAADANGVALTTGNGASSLCCDASGPFGYHAEGARTDVLGTTTAIRRTMSDAGWVASNVTKSTSTGADGTANGAATLTASAGNGTVLFTTVLAAAIRTFSAWVRRRTGTGTVNITGDNGATWTAITLTSSYQLFQFTTANVANPVVGFRIVTSGDAIDVDFNQLEAAAWASSPIDVATATRNADVLSYVTANNFGTAQGSAYFEITLPGNSTALHVAVSTSDAMLYANPSGTGASYDGTNNPTVAPTGGGPIYKYAMRYDSGGGTPYRLYLGGTAGTATAFDGSLNNATPVYIGGLATREPFGTIRNLRVYNRPLSDARLQAMTA